MINETKLKRSLGATVRHFRQQRGLTQRQLGDEMGVLRTYIADVERGSRNVSLANIVRLTEALGVSLSAFATKMDKLSLAELARPQRRR